MDVNLNFVFSFEVNLILHIFALYRINQKSNYSLPKKVHRDYVYETIEDGVKETILLSITEGSSSLHSVLRPKILIIPFVSMLWSKCLLVYFM